VALERQLITTPILGQVVAVRVARMGPVRLAAMKSTTAPWAVVAVAAMAAARQA
jgi:hypothetical protein